jgi:hypothetical protein
MGRTAIEGRPPCPSASKGEGFPSASHKPGRIGIPSPAGERPDGSHQG